MQLNILDLIVLAAYFVGLGALGLYFSSRNVSRDSYFLGDRQVHWFVAGISVLATLLSTVSYVSIPGEIVRFGIGYFSSYLALLISVPVISRFIIPGLVRVPATSVYEFLARRFSLAVKRVAALSFIITRVIWTGLILYTAAFAVSTMTGWPISAVVVTIGLVTVFYTSFGGFRAVLWSDLGQFLILFGGAVCIPIYIGIRTTSHPLLWWDIFSQAERVVVPVFSADPTVRISVFGIVLSKLVWEISTHGGDQVAAQRYLSTPSIGAAQRSFWIYSGTLLLMMIVLSVCGLAVFYFYFAQSGASPAEFQAAVAARADRLLPEFIARELPPGLSGLLLAALLSAAMSSLSSAINSIAAVFVDLLPEGRSRGLRSEALISVCVGLLGILSAIGILGLVETVKWNLVELMGRANHLFVAPLGALFFCGLFMPRVRAGSALTAFALGVASAIMIAFSEKIWGDSHQVSFMWIMPVSFAVTTFGAWALSRKGSLGREITESQ